MLSQKRQCVVQQETKKRHKTIQYDNESQVQNLVSELEENDDCSSSDDDVVDNHVELSYMDEPEYGLTDNEDSGKEETGSESDDDYKVLRSTEVQIATNQDGVFSFKRGDIGMQHILQYRIRPSLDEMDYDTNEAFEFQLHEIDYQHSWKKTFIRIYGVTRKGYSVVANIYDFEPYFVIRWPYDVTDIVKMDAFITTLDDALRKKHNFPGVRRYSIQEGIDTRCYMESYSTYMTLYMKDPSFVGKARRIIEDDDWEYADTINETYESDIDYVLRYMCDMDFTGECTLCVPAGAYRIRSLKQSTSTTDLEIDIPDYRELKMAKDQIDVSAKSIFSFDAEMKAEKGFPDPQKDPIIKIAARIRMLGNSESIKHVCLSVGSSNSIRDRHPGADVLCYECEVDMMLAFKFLFLVADPDIVTGYNIIDFDLSYFLERMEVLKHLDPRASKFAYLGRLIKRRTVVKESRYSDKAHGVLHGKEINVEGRVQFDMLKIMQKEFKLTSNTLNNVSKKFLGNQKEDMSYELIPEKDKTQKGRTELNSYCLHDAILPDLLMDKLRSLLKYIQKARVPGITIQSLLRRGLGFQGKSSVYRKFQRQTPRVFVYVRTEAQRKQDMNNESYGGAYVETPKKGYHTDPTDTLDFSALYPSIILAWNMCCTTRISVDYAMKRDWIRADLHGDGSDGDYFQIPNFKDDEKIELLKKLFKNRECLSNLYSNTDTCFVTTKHRVGIIPLILKEFLDKRKEVKREKMKHGECKDRLREYAADMVKDKEELILMLDTYRRHLTDIQELLKEKPSDSLKLEREVSRLSWKIEELSSRVNDTIDTRRQAAAEALSQAEIEEFLEILSDLFQLEIKLSANSIYGLFGAKTSFLYCRDIAAGVTSMGRYMIILTKLEVEREFCKANGYAIDAEVIYGDSVTADTPVLVQQNNHTQLLCIEDLPTDKHGWRQGINGKEHANPSPGLLILSDHGFIPVKELIRHKVCKPLKLVATHSGVVTVTQDHSLLRKNGETVKPTELQIDDELLTTGSTPNITATQTCGYEEGLFWLWGLFFTSGTCTFHDSVCNSWSITAEATTLTEAKLILENHYPLLHFILYESKLSLYLPECELQETGFFCGFWPKAPSRNYAYAWMHDWSQLFFRKHNKKVPDMVLHAPKDRQKCFLKACLQKKEIQVFGQIGAAGIQLLMQNVGHHVEVRVHMESKEPTYTLKICKNRRTSHVTGLYDVKQWYNEDSDKVYDIKTEDHHFAAGVGNLVVHNTDSIFVKMVGFSMEEARVMGMKMSEFAGKLWPAPHKLEAEKIYNPLLLVKKKKYAGYKYLMDPETGGLQDPKVDSSGLETVRRDSCKLASEVLETTLHLLLKATDGLGLERGITFIQEQVSILLRGDVNFYKLIISKQLRRDNYTNPTIHSVLAAKLGKRSGSRIPYLIVKKHKNAKMYECGEDPDIAFKTNAPIDFEKYMKKQIMEPIIRLFAPILVPNMDMDIKSHVKSIRQAVIRRIFVGDHMKIRKITFNLSENSMFIVIPQCKFCKRTLAKEESEYCNNCKKTRGEALSLQLRGDLERLSFETMCQWRECQSCMNVKVATHIVCDQGDCENYWKRRKTANDIAEISNKLQALDW